MKRIGAIVLLALALLWIPCYDGYAATPSFSGLWNTDQGELRIDVAGNRLTGLFPLSSRKLEGTVAGLRSSGTWREPPTYSPPHSLGKFEVALAGDGMRFTGKIFDSAGKLVGEINGERPVNPAIALSGTWSTNVGDVRLMRTGTQLSGFHYGLQAVISGSVDPSGKISFSVLKEKQTIAKIVGSFVGTGRVFKGWWSEPPSYAPPDEAGRVVFEFAADGAFTGTVYNGQDKVGVTLSGKRK
jgi:hypothetical protein